MKKYFFIIIFLLFLASFAQDSKNDNAQYFSDNLFFEHITIEHGLSQSSVRAILQDSKGFMWFGTNEGLNRYNGYNFKIFKNDYYDSFSISNNFIYSLAEDISGNLWVGTADGLNYYNQSTESFHKFNFTGNSYNYKVTKRIFSVIGNSFKDSSHVWFTTVDGIFRFDFIVNKLMFYDIGTTDSGKVSDKKIYIFRDSNENIWAASNINGIFKYDKLKDKFVNTFLLKPPPNGIDYFTSQFYEDDEKNIWFGANNGLNKFNLSSGEIINYKTTFEKVLPKNIKTGFINSITGDDYGYLWIGTSGYGLMRFNKKDETVRVFNHHPYDERSISLDVAHKVFKSRSGIIWIGTHGSGVDKLNPNINKFNFVKKTVNGLSAGSVRAFFEDAFGYIWISGYDGLDRYNKKTGKYNSYFLESENALPEYLNNIVYTFEEDKDNPEKFMYLGTEGSGVFKFDFEKKIFTKIYPLNSEKSNTGEEIISSLYDDGKGILWIGSFNGLTKYKKSTGSIIEYRHKPDDPESIRPQKVTSIFEDSYNNFWIGTDLGGLNLMNRNDGNFTYFQVNKKMLDVNPGSISGNHIKDIYEDKTGVLWIATTGGLNKFVRDKQLFKRFTIRDGLPNDVIYGILEDKEGNLWMSTNLGISKFNPTKQTFHNYDVRDGLQSNEFNTNAFLKSKSGKMYFGGINGFNSFFPENIVNNTFDPPILITDFQLFNRSLKIGKSREDIALLTKSIVETDTIKLDYDQNVINIEFVSLDYSSGKNLYSYKLEGFDARWSKPAKKRLVTYTNLDPGTYLFKVKGTNSDGVWNDKEASLTIIVVPPYWQTWWFYSLIIISIASVLYSIYRYRINKILEVERLRVGIASDLHDDIGSTLTKLALKADMIEKGIDTEDKSKSLKRISEMSRQSVSTMSDIVWSIDSRNDSFGSMINKMKDFAFGTLTGKEIKVEFNTSGIDFSEKVPLEMRQNLYLIFKEAINNITKHSKAENVYVSFSSGEKSYSLIIKDDGENFQKKEFDVGHGLKNMKMRAKKINAEIEFKNEKGFEISVTGKFKDIGIA